MLILYMRGLSLTLDPNDPNTVVKMFYGVIILEFRFLLASLVGSVRC